jgi:hypothetical protein
MTQTWMVKAWAGPYSWTTTDASPAGYGLASPLEIAQNLPASDLAPLVQPDAATATFQVIVATATDLDQLQLGHPVCIRYWPSTAPAAGDLSTVGFAGRVATLEAEPHDLGLLFTVGCVDYTADLGEATVGIADFPSESITVRVQRILTDAGMNVPAGAALFDGGGVFPVGAPVLALRPAAPANALELMGHTLAQWDLTYGSTAPNQHGPAILRQVLTPALAAVPATGPSLLDTTNGPYQVARALKTPSYTAPLRVTLTAGKYQLVGSTATGAATGVQVIDAGRVEASTRFRQRKGDAVNAVSVNAAAFGARIAFYSIADGVVTRVGASVDTELVDPTQAAGLAATYLPPVLPTQLALWVTDAMTWRLDAEPGAWTLPTLGRGLMVVRVATVWAVMDREWVTGLVAGVTFRLVDGAPQVVLNLIPWNQDPTASVNPVKWSDLVAGQTYTSTFARDTFNDYALAGV